MRVLIVDDHPLYRDGIRALIAEIDPDAVTCDVSSAADASVLARAGHEFDLVLLDMHLPGMSGLDALRCIRAHFEVAAVVVVSADENPSLILGAIDAGAAGYIPKTTDSELTTHALNLCLSHGTYLPVGALRHLETAQVNSPSGRPSFSERQRAVLLRLLQGKSNKVIARELDIAEGTVKAHLWSIYQVLGVNSRTQAMCRVHDLKLLGQISASEQ